MLVILTCAFIKHNEEHLYWQEISAHIGATKDVLTCILYRKQSSLYHNCAAHFLMTRQVKNKLKPLPNAN